MDIPITEDTVVKYITFPAEVGQKPVRIEYSFLKIRSVIDGEETGDIIPRTVTVVCPQFNLTVIDYCHEIHIKIGKRIFNLHDVVNNHLEGALNYYDYSVMMEILKDLDEVSNKFFHVPGSNFTIVSEAEFNIREV